MMRLTTTLSAVLLFLAVPPVAGQAPLSGATATIDLPPELSVAVASQLSTDAVRVTAGATPVTLEFWWVKSLPMKAGTGAPSWADVEEGTLVGAVRLASDYRDIRGRVIKPGTYTLRYAIQPANGDHLGVSPFREFLLLSPAALDTDPAPRGHDGTIELSKRAIGGSHPGVWSMDPPVASDAPLSVHKTELGHDAIVMEVTSTRGPYRFGLVLIGKIEA